MLVTSVFRRIDVVMGMKCKFLSGTWCDEWDIKIAYKRRFSRLPSEQSQLRARKKTDILIETREVCKDGFSLLLQIIKMPRVVPDQRSKFENDELFRKLARESEVFYIHDFLY